MLKRVANAGAVLVAGGLLAIGLFSPAAAVRGGSDEPASGPPDDYNVDEALGWDTNLDLIESLAGVDECLYRHSVFPAGGVGYADSSLPYEGFDEPDRALLTLRAETLRTYPDSVMDVVSTGEAGAARVTIVALAEPEGSARFSLDELRSVNQHVDNAVRTIQATGAEVIVDLADAPSLIEVCEIEDQFRTMKNKNGEQVTVLTQPLPLEHVVEATVNVNDAQFAEAILRTYGPHARLTTMEGRYEDANRTSDYAPFFGGDRMYSGGQGLCSTSFLVNGNSILTADHCGWQNYYSNNGNWIGTAGYSQAGGSVDAMVLAGTTYSNRVWLGPLVPTSSLPAYGIYPEWTLTPGNSYLLISGSFSGQGTLTFQGQYGSSGCLTTAWGTGCFLSRATASGGICIGGDSGGPIAVYDAANSRLIPTGTVKARSLPDTSTHDCLFTSVATIAYGYGGATIG